MRFKNYEYANMSWMFNFVVESQKLSKRSRLCFIKHLFVMGEWTKWVKGEFVKQTCMLRNLQKVLSLCFTFKQLWASGSYTYRQPHARVSCFFCSSRRMQWEKNKIISVFIIRGIVVVITHVKRRVECGTESIEKKLLSKQDSIPRHGRWKWKSRWK
jgi:hypothetical protein